MDFNAGGILAFYNVRTKAPLEPDGNNQSQVD